MNKNKYDFKKCLKHILIAITILSIIFLVITTIEYKNNTKTINLKLLTIINNIKEKNIDITDDEIYNILNSNTKPDLELPNTFSVFIEKESLINDLDKYNSKYQILNLIYFIISLFIVLIIFLKYNKKKDKNISSITKSIEQINKKNYKLDLDEMSEDELSILKNEIYKTTIMLKEQAENSINDKIKLKDSLSDISHQLKTPLTAIMIRLDNLIDYPNIQEEKKQQFIKEIKIEVTNINFLVQSILKLSKLESNTIEYNNKDVNLSNLVKESVNRLLPLCDLKNIKVNILVEKDAIINCDATWQIEALSNIIKNSIEHSNHNNKVDIIINTNEVYNSIIIKDYGKGINENDINHIFDRFYKGKNADSNSIGIGLSLSKTIINKAKGTITVTSTEGKGTTFTIKYYK